MVGFRLYFDAVLWRIVMSVFSDINNLILICPNLNVRGVNERI